MAFDAALGDQAAVKASIEAVVVKHSGGGGEESGGGGKEGGGGGKECGKECGYSGGEDEEEKEGGSSGGEGEALSDLPGKEDAAPCTGASASTGGCSGSARSAAAASACTGGSAPRARGVRRRQHLRAQGRVRSRCKEYGCARAAAETLDGEDLRR